MFRHTTARPYITTTLTSFTFINTRIQDPDKATNFKISIIKINRPYRDTGSSLDRAPHIPANLVPKEAPLLTFKFGDVL
jgi:hypothetical protein